MKTFKKAILLAGAVALLRLAVPAFAAETPAIQSFGVVDMNKVLQMTDAAKEIFNQLESKRKEYQSQISKEEEKLRSAEQEILKEKDSLSKEAFDKKRREFEESLVNGQKLVQDRKMTLDHAFNTSMAKLRNEAAKIIAKVAEERRYTAVLTQDAVMISTNDMDMTGVVIERMNKGVKKIPVDWTPPAAAAEKTGKKKK